MTRYNQQLADEICERLASGESLRSICEGEGMPDERTVRRWALDDVEGFSPQYTRARQIGYERFAEDIIRIADTPVIGRKITSKEWGEEITEADMIEHRKLQVDTRKWMLSKMLPKVYGDKSSMELTGADGGPVQVSDTERAAKIAAILAAAKARKDADESDVADLL